MLYRPVLAMVIVAVIYTCSACAGQEDDLKDPGTEDSAQEDLLTEEYMPDSMISDVSGILEDDIAERAGNYTDSVCAIAFYENKVTDTECVYYDLETGKRYRASNLYLFSDLKQTEPEDYEDGEKLAGELERHGVFSPRPHPAAYTGYRVPAGRAPDGRSVRPSPRPDKSDTGPADRGRSDAA